MKLFSLSLLDAYPSTSRQAIESVRNTDGPSTTSRISPHKKKPFIKFKDEKYRKAESKRHKLNLKKNFIRSSLHLPTTSAPSPSQIVSRKILRSIKKRKNPLSRPNIALSPTKTIFKTNFGNFASNRPNSLAQMVSIKTEVKNEDMDDDCVCIETQPEVILIEDESLATDSIVKDGETNIQELKDYEPIGSMRMNQLNNNSTMNMLTSTPKYKLRCNNFSTNTFYADILVSENTLKDKKNINTDVVVIDDVVSTKNIVNHKRKRYITDDSVIFVSEQNGNSQSTAAAAVPAFIPLDTPEEESHFRIIPITPTPKAKRPRNELFSCKEQKQLRAYNDNAYNPNKDVPTLQPKKRMVLVDGSNVAYHHALNKEFSVKGLKICLDYFEKMGHEVKAVVPQFRLQRQKSSDPTVLEQLHKDGKIVFTPCKNLPGKSSSSYDDRFVLQLAAELDAAVVSNDNYRDLINENSAFKKIIENRVIGYTWCNDLFILPKDPYGKWGPTLSSILNRT